MSICQSATEEIDSQIFKKIGEQSSKKQSNTYSDDEYDTVEGRVAMLAEIPSSSESSKQRLDSAQDLMHGQSNQTADFDGYNQAAYNSMPQLPLVAYSVTEHSGGGYEFLEKIREENETEKWTCSNDLNGSTDGKGRDSVDETLANTKKELDLLNNQIQRNIDDNHASQRRLEALQHEEFELKDEPIRYSELQAISKHRHQSELIQPNAASPGKNLEHPGSQLMSFALSNSQPDTDLFASSQVNDGLGQTPEHRGDGSDQTPPRDYMNTLRQYKIEQSGQTANMRQSDLTEDNRYDLKANGEQDLQTVQACLFENENHSPNKINMRELLNQQNYQSTVSFSNQMKLNSPDFSNVLGQRDKAKMTQPPAKSVPVRSPRQSNVSQGKSLGYETSSRDFLNADLNLASFHNYIEMNDYEGDIKEDSMKIIKVQRKKVSDHGKSRNDDSNQGECGGSNSIGIFNQRFMESEITRSMASAQTNQEQQDHEKLSPMNRSKKQFHETTVLQGAESFGHQNHPIKIVHNETLRPESGPSSTNSPGAAAQSEKTKIFYIIERIRQTQQLFMQHECIDLLIGKDQSSWVNIDDYVEDSNKTLLDLLGQIMDQHDSLSVNVIHLLAQMHLKDTQMEQLKINLEHARASGEAQLKETFENTVTAIKENFETKVNDFKKQTLTESSKQQLKNNQLIQEQMVYQQSLQKCKEIIQVQQEQRESTVAQMETQYKDLIQMQKEKMERMQMQNERMHQTIAQLKDDLARYIDKDELVRKTFDLNATQLVNMEKTIQQQTRELNRLQQDNETQRATITDLKEQNEQLNHAVSQREDIESQNQLLRYLEGLMLDRPTNHTMNVPNNTVKLENMKENSKYNTGSKLQMNEMLMNIDENGVLMQDGHENVLMGVPPSLVQTYDPNKLKNVQNAEAIKKGDTGFISAEFNLSHAQKGKSIPEGLIPDFADQQILTEPSLVNTKASEGLQRMMEKSASRNELKNQTQNGVNSEFKEDTFGESTLLMNPDLRGEGSSILKNTQKVLMRTNQYPITSNTTKIELNFLASAKNVDQNQLMEREIFENLSVRKSTSSSNRQNSTKRSKSSNTSRGNYQSRDLTKIGKPKLQYNTGSSVDGSNPFQMTDTNQAHCDLLSRHVSILGQNEQIIKQFKQREKEMIDTYDRIVADQDTKLKFLDLQKEEAQLSYTKKIKELQAIISEEAQREADLQKNLETERDNFEQTAEGLRNTIKQNVDQIKSLEERIAQLKEDTKKEIEELKEKEKREKEELQSTLKQQHETELNIIKNSHQDELEKAWRDLEVKDEVVNQNYKTIDEFSQQMKEYHETILKLTEEKNAIHNVNLELMDEYEELVLRNDKLKIEKEQLLNEKEQMLKDQQVLLDEHKALEDQNKTLADSNDVFQSTIIDELNKLNESIVIKKNKKNKEKQQKTLRNLLGNFQQSMGLTTDETVNVSKSRYSKSRSPTGKCHNQSKSRSPSNHHHQPQLNRQLQCQQYEPRGQFSKTMTSTLLEGQPFLQHHSSQPINAPQRVHLHTNSQPSHVHSTFEGDNSINNFAAPVNGQTMSNHYHLQTCTNPTSQDTTLHHCKANLNDSSLTDQHLPNHQSKHHIIYESRYGQNRANQHQYQQSSFVISSAGQEGVTLGSQYGGEVGQEERNASYERNLTGILQTGDDRGLQSTRSGNHQRHNTISQFQNMNLHQHQQSMDAQQQCPQQPNLKSKFAQNFQQTQPQPIRVFKSHSPVRPDHSSAKRVLNEVNHQCNVMDLIIDSISQTTGLQLHEKQQNSVNQQQPNQYQIVSPIPGTRGQATPRGGPEGVQQRHSNSNHSSGQNQPMLYQNAQNNDCIGAQASVGQQSARRRTRSRRARLSTSREHNLDTSAQHTARMYSGERTIAKTYVPTSIHPNQSHHDPSQFGTKEKREGLVNQPAPLEHVRQSSRDLMLNVGSSSAKSLPNGGGLSHRGSQYNFKSLKLNS